MKPKPTRRYPVAVERVPDGDNLLVTIDLGFGLRLHDRMCRLEGINCDEMHDKDLAKRTHAQAAQQRLLELAGKTCEIETAGETEKFGRLLVKVHVAGQMLTANEILVIEGLAVPYDGHGPRAMFQL